MPEARRKRQEAEVKSEYRILNKEFRMTNDRHELHNLTLMTTDKLYYHCYNRDCKYHSYPAFTLCHSPMTPDPTTESHSGSQAESDFPAYLAVGSEYDQCKDRIDTGNKYLVAIDHYKIEFSNGGQGGNDYETDTDLYEPAIDPDKEKDNHCSNELAAS